MALIAGGISRRRQCAAIVVGRRAMERWSDGRRCLVAGKKEDLRVIAVAVTRGEWAAVDIEMCLCMGSGW